MDDIFMEKIISPIEGWNNRLTDDVINGHSLMADMFSIGLTSIVRKQNFSNDCWGDGGGVESEKCSGASTIGIPSRTASGHFLIKLFLILDDEIDFLCILFFTA